MRIHINRHGLSESIFSLKTCLLLLLLIPVASFAQEEHDAVTTEETSTTTDDTKPSKYVPPTEEDTPKLTFFQGFTVSADVLGLGQYFLSDYGCIEGALRLNLKNTYFPIFEAGLGKCDMTDGNTDIHYETHAPYFRIGFDMNMLKNKFQDNRLYLGARYGLSFYNFDISGPAQTDDIWGGSEAYNVKGVSTTSHWLEIVFGVQVKIWRSFHMGWSVRYKRELSSTSNNYAKPYYIPGYGTTTNSTCWGGTFNLIFDLNWGKRPTP